MNAHDILKYGNGTFQQSLSAIPKEQWEIEGVCGWWTVKNVVAHLASYELALVDVLNGCLGNEQSPLLHEFQTSRAFNDDQVNARQTKTPDDTLAEYVAAYDKAMRLIVQIAPEKLREVGTLPWYGAEYAI